MQICLLRLFLNVCLKCFSFSINRFNLSGDMWQDFSSDSYLSVVACPQTVAAASARLREGGSAPLTMAELRQLLQQLGRIGKVR